MLRDSDVDSVSASTDTRAVVSLVGRGEAGTNLRYPASMQKKLISQS
jgi:hypothetical protein